MLDICDLIRFFSKCFKKVNPVTTVNVGGSEHTVQGTEKSNNGGSSKNIF
jgi:hypothetical protein